MRNAKKACPVITTAFREAQPSYHDTGLIFIFNSSVFTSQIPIHCLSFASHLVASCPRSICLPIAPSILSLLSILPPDF